MNNRLSLLRRQLPEKQVDGVFITNPENRRYISGFDGSAGYLLVTEKRAVLATDFRYIEQANTEAPEFEIHHISGSSVDWFPELVLDSGISRLAFEAADISFVFHLSLVEALRSKQLKVEMVAVNSLVESLRAVKEPKEIELITRAAAITDTAFETVEPCISAGMTEKEIAWELEKSLRENGSQSLPFEIIVASGPQAALPHAKPSDRAIGQGEPVVIDMGARFGGYACDLSRTVCIGTPDASFRKVYSAVLDAQVAAMAIINRGMTGDEADQLAREIIKKAGYGEAFGHSLGHGVGLAAHESPRVGPGYREQLTDGMVFTIEPGIYLPGWGGVRIEDTVVLEEGKLRVLSKARKVKYD